MGTAQYDSVGGAYDRLAGLDLYHRFFWGVSTKAYRDFAGKAMDACRTGLLLDAGCGSMLFTASKFSRGQVRMFGADVSGEMLKRARRRLGEPGHLTQTDLLRLPFAAQAFDAVICLHVAHVMDDLEGLVRALRVILKPGGQLFLTSVVLVGHLRDSYLRFLAKCGIMGTPRKAEGVISTICRVFGVEPRYYLTGSMLFTETTLPDSHPLKSKAHGDAAP